MPASVRAVIDQRQSWYLGHLGVIPVYAHWTFILFIPFVVLIYQGPLSVYIISLLSFVLLFSILLHELGHAAASLVTGARDVSITLWAMGGLTNLGGGSNHPGRQIFITACGPAVNLCLWLGCMALLRYGSPDLIGYPILLEIIGVTMFVNKLLFILNILPIYPLDGGLIAFHGLRSFLPMSLVTKICLVLAVVTAVAFYVYRCYDPAMGVFHHDWLLAALLALFVYQSFNAYS